jgi:hypothetical protein
MVRVLASPDPTVRAHVVVVLGSFGPSARPSASALGALLQDPQPRVGELTGDALDRVYGVVPASLMTCH